MIEQLNEIFNRMCNVSYNAIKYSFLKIQTYF